ncbi:MAG TPA: GNAT family N-acetyltransferase [Xanthobacteraceae bacterium]|nr:GNAT family N-acetyltransferase [Xanthobacteraceae bacterium]
MPAQRLRMGRPVAFGLQRVFDIAQVEVFDTIAAAEPVWRMLEQYGAWSTPFQRFDFLNAWQNSIGAAEGSSPFIIIASNADRRPLVLLPLVVERANGLQTLRFMGGKHATFNMMVADPAYAARMTEQDLATMFDAVRDRGVDLLAFERQPEQWHGIANPMMMLPTQASVNECPLLRIAENSEPADRISNSFRRRLRGKERKLQALPGYRHYIARTDSEIERLLGTFFRIKPIRMAQQKLPDVFAEPGAADFIRDACFARLSPEKRAIEIHALESDDDVLAIFAGVADGHRFSMMFNTYTLSDSAKYSPGLILLRNVIDHYAEAGYTSIDLGMGNDEYKRLFCKDFEQIRDSFIPLSALGKLGAIAQSSVAHTKRAIKQNSMLADVVQKIRSTLRR